MIQPGFAEYLAERWPKFDHRYVISKHRAWATWREMAINSLDGIWYCASLREAAKHYSWTGGDLACFAAPFADALAQNDSTTVKQLCEGIFEWGGVARSPSDPSRQWVLRCAADGSLAEKIKMAVERLTAPSASLEEFDGSTLLMNSAMTKVYAAADPAKRLIIYDGRVGAALGLIARDFVRDDGMAELPLSLAFRWGPSRASKTTTRLNERNPSDERFRFPTLYQGKDRNQCHAHWARVASSLLDEAIRLIGRSGENVSPTQFEKALFMVGYDVGRTLRIGG